MRNGLKAKLADSRGETLTEMLVSILIGSLSVGLLFTGIAASVRINRKAEQMDAVYYEDLSNAEKRDGEAGAQGKVTIESRPDGERVTIDIDIYGGDGLYSYRKTQDTAEGGRGT